jgi:hypothetical protein
MYSRISRPELNFAPPFATLASNAEGFNFWWMQMQYVFDLPNPHRFPKLRIADCGDAKRLRRYERVCEELAQSTLLSYNGGFTLSWKQGDDAPRVETDAPPVEVIRGVCATFRQVASDNELASYTSVRKIIGAAIEVQDDEHRDQRREWQKRWNRARGQLNMFSLKYLAESKIHAELGHRSPGESATDADARPLALIKKFQYGDLLHWGDTRDDLEDLQQDAVQYAIAFHQFLTSVIQLSHFYLGYACIASRVDVASSGTCQAQPRDGR